MEDSIRVTLLQILGELLGYDHAATERDYLYCKEDSLLMVDYLHAVEVQLEVDLPNRCSTFDELCSLVAGRLAPVDTS